MFTSDSLGTRLFGGIFEKIFINSILTLKKRIMEKLDIPAIISIHKREIKKQELYIKLYRVNIMTETSRIKQWEYFIEHNKFPVWERTQEKKINEIWGKIMNKIQELNNN